MARPVGPESLLDGRPGRRLQCAHGQVVSFPVSPGLGDALTDIVNGLGNGLGNRDRRVIEHR
jgi:hypothetical protein